MFQGFRRDLCFHAKQAMRVRSASDTQSSVLEEELDDRIGKGQFNVGKLRTDNKTTPEIWNAVLAA
jgi:hypothetical protein